MRKKTRLARVDEEFLKLVKDSGMTTPSYTRRIVEKVKQEKEDEIILKMNKRGFNFRL